MPPLTHRVRVGLVLIAAPLLLPGAARAASVTRTYTARGETVFSVPAGVSTVSLTVTGERGKTGVPGVLGSDGGGYAAHITGTLAVNPGEKLYLEVGVGGGKAGDGFFASGDGGGASTVQICPASGAFCSQAPGLDPLFSRLLIAGGGGGGGAGIPGSVYGTSGGDASLPGGSGAPGQNGASGTGGAGATVGGGGAGGVSSVSTGGDGQRGVGGDGATLHGSGYRIGGAGGGGGLFGGGGSAFVWEAAGAPVAGGGGGESWVQTATITEALGIATTIGNAIGMYATNTPNPSITVTYNDTVAPQPTLATPAPGQQVGARPTFSGTASTGLGDTPAVTVTVATPGGSASIDAPADGTGAWSLTWPTALPAGLRAVTVSQDDDAGNTGTTSEQAFTVDTAAPAIVLQQPAAGAALRSHTPVFSGLAATKPKDLLDIGVDVFVGATATGAPVQSRLTARRLDGTFSIVAAPDLPDGLYTAVARQTDNGQHEGTSTRTFRIDTTAPAIDIAAPADGAEVTQGSALTLSYACTDAGAGIASCTGAVPSSTALDTSTVGERTETITATDLAGNTASRSVRYVVQPSPAPAPASTGQGTGGVSGRIAPQLAVTKVRIGKAKRGCEARRARLAVTGRMRACRVKVMVQGTIDARAAGQRLTVAATRRRARTVTASTVLRSGHWKLTLTLPATKGSWKLAASVPGDATLLPSTARRTLALTARR